MLTADSVRKHISGTNAHTDVHPCKGSFSSTELMVIFLAEYLYWSVLIEAIGRLQQANIEYTNEDDRAMTEASNYANWWRAAREIDQRTGADVWQEREQSTDYDYKIIRYRYDELLQVRRSGSPQRLMYYLNEGLHGNMGGMGSAALYSKAKTGTKNLITNYLQELTAALDDLEASAEKDIPHLDKLNYFRRAGICFGRTALMFSGAGSLGAFHVGVAKELAAHDLLPRVISGASAGSVVAAMIGTHKQDELVAFFDQESADGNIDALDETQGIPNEPSRIQLDDLRSMINSTIPDLTFLEAYELSGVHINISVAPSELHQRSRMLNAATSPNAFIREAVLASCSIPGVFPAVTLMAKDGKQRRPYVASRKWVDGSITDDLPAKRIARQYGVNHFISSQANPIVLWGITPGEAGNDLLSRLTAISQRGMRDWLRLIYPTVLESVRNIHPINTYTRFWFSLMTQEYTADINLIPERNILSPCKVLSQLTPEESKRLINAGAQATWPKIEMIRNCTMVSRRIDDALTRLERAEF